MIKTWIQLQLLAVLTSAHEHSEQTPLVYGLFKEECFTLLDQPKGLRLFIDDKECFKFTISKIVGYLIVLGSMIVKVPQIMKICLKCSAKGVSDLSYYVETIAYLQIAAYSMHLGLQFSTYGENWFIFCQNLAIILLMWEYDHQIPKRHKLAFSVFIVAYSILIFGGFMPEHGWAYISSSTIVLNLLSRIPQII